MVSSGSRRSERRVASTCTPPARNRPSTSSRTMAARRAARASRNTSMRAKERAVPGVLPPPLYPPAARSVIWAREMKVAPSASPARTASAAAQAASAETPAPGPSPTSIADRTSAPADAMASRRAARRAGAWAGDETPWREKRRARISERLPRAGRTSVNARRRSAAVTVAAGVTIAEGVTAAADVTVAAAAGAAAAAAAAAVAAVAARSSANDAADRTRPASSAPLKCAVTPARDRAGRAGVRTVPEEAGTCWAGVEAMAGDGAAAPAASDAPPAVSPSCGWALPLGISPCPPSVSSSRGSASIHAAASGARASFARMARVWMRRMSRRPTASGSSTLSCTSSLRGKLDFEVPLQPTPGNGGSKTSLVVGCKFFFVCISGCTQPMCARPAAPRLGWG
eukprot:scaffold699_cov66-Isochrysis_galbana.AAC.2